MFKKLILCATPQKLIAGVWRMGQLSTHQQFANDEAGYQQFARFIETMTSTPVYLVVDAVEEDYRHESLPHTLGQARREMVQRKLTQLFRNSQYRAAQWMGRDSQQRKDDRYLMVSISNHEFFRPWMELLKSAQAPLVGVYLLSMLSQALIKRLKINHSHFLFTERLSSGLRQSYFNEGVLRVSRMVPISTSSVEHLSGMYVNETEKTRLYLIGQRLLPRDSKLPIVIPSFGAENQAICREIVNVSSMPCEAVLIQDLIKGLHWSETLIKEHPELLHMHLLAIGDVPSSLAPTEASRFYQLHQINRGLWITATSILMLGISVASYNEWNRHEHQREADRDGLETEVQMRQYEDVAKSFPKTNVSGGDLERAVHLYQRFQGYSRSPERDFKVLALVLDKFPDIQINRILRMLTNQQTPQDTENTADNGLSPDANNPSSAGAASAYVPDTNELRTVIFVNAEITRFNGNYRAALALVNEVVDALKKQSDVADVAVLQWPVNVSSLTNLKGSTTDSRQEAAAPATFKLRVTLKLEESKS